MIALTPDLTPSPELVANLPGLIAPVLLFIGGIVAHRMQRGTQREMTPAQIITTLQSELTHANDRLDKAERKAAEADQRARDLEAETRERMDLYERRERLLLDYVHALRNYIGQGQGPPPPPWPTGLDRA